MDIDPVIDWDCERLEEGSWLLVAEFETINDDVCDAVGEIDDEIVSDADTLGVDETDDVGLCENEGELCCDGDCDSEEDCEGLRVAV